MHNADTLATSYSIVSAAKLEGEFDLIFCGKETLDGATGQMGAQLAERFDAAQVTSASLIKSIDPENIRTRLLGFEADAFDPELDIADCETIVCVGSPVKEESLPKYRELAALLGGKLACTRPVVDRELLPYKLQVGQSGVMIKPKLYIGFGVSGAVNHVTGIDAGKFIAVNTDPNAAIFNYCDYGIVGDMDEVCDEMIRTLK